ncbi:hypothetical protein PRIPAC_81315, partial [Pristionchus pacificus]|uniref:G protein-coupled receptor n=1 Tax=Pristionchus pacificus TaxID=54126 RepID=A0A2A6CMS0_PRIPA
VVSAPDNATILVCIRPCSLINDDLCHQTHVTLTSLTNQSTLLILLSFCYRLYILEKAAVQNANGTYIWFLYRATATIGSDDIQLSGVARDQHSVPAAVQENINRVCELVEDTFSLG